MDTAITKLTANKNNFPPILNDPFPKESLILLD